MTWVTAQFVNKYTTLIYKGFYAQLVYVCLYDMQLDGHWQQARSCVHACMHVDQVLVNKPVCTIYRDLQQTLWSLVDKMIWRCDIDYFDV